MLALVSVSVLAFLPAQEIAPGELAGRCGSEIPWITDGVVLKDNETMGGRRGKTKKVDRSELMGQAQDRAKELQRLILWYVPRVTGTHMNRAVILDGYAQSQFFTDEALIDLIRSKFVPLKMVADGPIGGPLGVRPFGFIEPGFVFLSPSGTVVHTIDRIRTFNAAWLLHAFRSVLLANPEFNAPSGSTPDDLLRGGDYDRIPDSAPAYVRGRAMRRLRRSGEALALLKTAKEPDAQVELGLLLLNLGRQAEARPILERAAESPSDRAPEAHYWLAHIDHLEGRDPEAERRWKKIVSSHPGSRWAWRAADNLVRGPDELPGGAIHHSFEDMLWPPASAFSGTPTSTRLSHEVKEADAVARAAVEWLLRNQRPSGAWEDSRYVYCGGLGILPNVFVSATALAATALMEWRDVDPARIDLSVARAEAYLLDESHVNRGQNEECYADAYRLLYLAGKHGRKPDPGLLERMSAIAAALGKQQKKDGSWAHEYPNPFCTAAVVECLFAAKNAGADVDPAMLERATTALLKSRSPKGRHPYSAGAPPSPAGSMARNPLCEHALFLSGKASVDDLGTSLERYWKYRDRLEAIRVTDFHADGELGGFFYFHGVFHASQAALKLPTDRRPEQQAKFLTQMTSIPEIDGSFIDSHELGKGYGTAMALLVLRNSREGR